jgi:uncharacterized membrane protein
MEIVLLFLASWKVEIIGSILLVALLLLKRHYDSNVIVAGYLRQAIDAVATQMEAAPDVEPKDLKRSAKKARRREIRRKIAKEARKANRGTGKGNKKGGGKVK